MSDAMVKFLNNNYNSINCPKPLLAVFLDFLKAFDMVNFIILQKVDYLGIRNFINLSFKSYLSNYK